MSSTATQLRFNADPPAPSSAAMSQFRRQDDRRRRVLMTSAWATAASPTTGSRSRIESMREARRPTLVYGTRVREGLRGRWFSLVPVDRSALAKLLAAILAIVLAIVLMNDATVRFQSIESQPAFVNVFQIIRPGSLGRYAIGVMYLVLAGAAWMVYQLRRFRNDDFRGNYRLWQWIVGVSLVASIATVVPLLAMCGAGVELLMGRRIALSGHDWIGLFMVVGGAILALRTIAEMWRYRASLVLMIGGWFCVAIPVAAQWNVVAVDTNMRWSIVTAAPLLAVTLWFAATVSYLRLLYREVRGIERSTGFLQRLKNVAPRPFARVEPSDAATNTSAEDEPSPSRKSVAAKVTSPTRVRETTAASETAGTDKTDAKRRWFGLLPPAKPRVAKTEPAPSKTTKPRSEKTRPGNAKPIAAQVNNDWDDDDSNDQHSIEKSEMATETKPKRRWWPSLRGRSKAKPDAGTTDDDVAEESVADQADSTDAAPQKRRFGLGSMMKRNRDAPSGDTDADENNSKTTSPKRSESNSAAKGRPATDAEDDDDDDSDEEGYADDGIDWSSMNKSERRRMRKQLKRGGKAA